MSTVRVNRRAAERLAAGHPWVYASDVTGRGGAQPGEVATVVGPASALLGVAHYSSTSQIALRLLHHKPTTIDAAFYQRRIAAAFHHRQQVVHHSNAYRLVHAEADLLPGLIVDS